MQVDLVRMQAPTCLPACSASARDCDLNAWDCCHSHTHHVLMAMTLEPVMVRMPRPDKRIS